MDLTEVVIWEDGIYQLETTDVVLAGPGGISNRQAQELANRTAYLHSLRGKFEGIFTLNVNGANTIATGDLLNKHVVLSPQISTGSVTLSGVSGLPEGSVISISVSALPATWGRPVNILPPVGSIYGYRGSNNWAASSIYLYTGESVTMVKNGTRLIFLATDSNMYQVGEILHSYKPPLSALEARGQVVNRADYPRLWTWLQLSGAPVISDSTWLSNPLNYSGCFTAGNGSTTFRMPDLRSMFIRGLDNGRNLDLDRSYNNAGGYEADQLSSHSHQASGTVNQNTPDFGNGGAGYDIFSGTVTTTNTGGSETRPKNVGYTAYIKY